MLRDDIRAVLRAGGIRLDTDLGQHFLVDEEALADIVAAADLSKDDHVVEIGPGIGILTRELQQKAKHVTAIELDNRLIPLLKNFCAQPHESMINYQLSIINSNALHTPMPETPYKVVANIPYHITSPLLTHLLLEGPIIPTSLTLLIQREVAENICSAGSPSLLTILVRLAGEPVFVRSVAKDAFLPPPKIESAVVHIACFDKLLRTPAEARAILKVAKHAFSKRRKMLRNSIGTLPGGEKALTKTGIDPMRRPETLELTEWMALADALSAQSGV